MWKKISENKILKIAIPSIVSNITVPLLGMVDIFIVGHLGSAAYIGAIAVGGMMFNIIYWIFAFLRMGTTGMTSQAFGKRNLDEVVRLLLRSLGSAAFIAVMLIILQVFVLQIVFILIDSSPEVKSLAIVYFRILIWGAPAVLGLYGLTGWFFGMQNSRFPMVIAIVQNLVNIVASVLLVFVFRMKVEGVAFGTLIAQYAGFFTAGILWWIYYKSLRKRIVMSGLWNLKAMIGFLSVNKDIFLRTLCLVAVTLYFTKIGASQGTIILAVNTLLMQFFILFSFFMDGFAYAGEALVGKNIGAKNFMALKKTIRELFMWGFSLTLIFTAIYFFGNKVFLNLFTNDKTVVGVAENYVWWVCAIPLASIVAFMWDGVFVGAIATSEMLLSMAIAAVVFFLTYFLLFPYLKNNALWIAFLTYLSSRGLIQTFLYKRALRKAIFR